MGVWFIPAMTLHIHQPVITLQIRCTLLERQGLRAEAWKQNMIVVHFPTDELQITRIIQSQAQ